MDKLGTTQHVTAVLKKMTGGKYTPIMLERLVVDAEVLHESKAHFKRDKNSIDQIFENCLSLYLNLRGMSAPQKKRLTSHSQKMALQSEELSVEKIAGVEGICDSLIGLLNFFSTAFIEERNRLEDQKARYWSRQGRSPNWRARLLAKWVAGVYVQYLKKKPTYGTDRNYPSTPYARALQEIFEIYQIDMDIRKPAEWAISQITEEDVERSKIW